MVSEIYFGTSRAPSPTRYNNCSDHVGAGFPSSTSSTQMLIDNVIPKRNEGSLQQKQLKNTAFYSDLTAKIPPPLVFGMTGG